MFVCAIVRLTCHHLTQNTFPSFPLLSYLFHYSCTFQSVCDCVASSISICAITSSYILLPLFAPVILFLSSVIFIFYVYRYIYIHRIFILIQALLYLLSLYMEYVSRCIFPLYPFCFSFSRSCTLILWFQIIVFKALFLFGW